MPETGAELSVELRQGGPIPLDVEFSCDSGRILALVGPSGSGKSTLLRSIAGVYTPAEGRVACGGEVWLDTARGIDLPTRRRSVGLVFQSYALFPHLSALHNITEALGHIPPRERAEKAKALLSATRSDSRTCRGSRAGHLQGRPRRRQERSRRVCTGTFITSPHSGAPTTPVPTFASSFAKEPTLRGFS